MSSPLVLITGGAGFLGINLCRFLLTRGYAVRSLDIAPFDYPERVSVDAILGDVRNRAAVRQAMQGVTFVVHAAAALPLSSRAEIQSTDVEGTRVVLEEARLAQVTRFVFISSTAVYGVPDHHPIKEGDPLHGVGPYGEAKIQAERLCEAERARGSCISVLRPKSFVGPERLGVFEMLFDFAFQGRNFPVLGSGKNLYQLLDVEDVCQAIHLCLIMRADLVNDTFNLGACQFGTLRESFQAVLDRAGHGKRVIGIPAAPAIAILRLLERLHLSPIYQWIYDTAGRDSYVSVKHIDKRLGFTPQYSNEQALIRNYDWYVSHRSEIGKRTGVSHRTPWKRGALRLAEHFF
ncbi:MAG TPA: NAD-dependent epimerase/dehydratase family protein [Steroidobacteraceae bacterium]|nr:NAD-dependent epimerase/dehydratase family protein [Steroidobacteraceae bacterium]